MGIRLMAKCEHLNKFQFLKILPIYIRFSFFGWEVGMKIKYSIIK